jgi:hypothetical protein
MECEMKKKLSEIIKELEDRNAIVDCYLHREYYTGKIELNIEFNNEIADEILETNEIDEFYACAYWE